MIFVFAKTPDAATASLVKRLDEVVAAHADKKLAAVVNFMGEPTDEFCKQIGQFADKNNIQHVTLTVTKDASRFKVNEAAKITVMHYKGKEVKFNFAVDEGGLNRQAIEKIVRGVRTILQ